LKAEENGGARAAVAGLKPAEFTAYFKVLFMRNLPAHLDMKHLLAFGATLGVCAATLCSVPAAEEAAPPVPASEVADYIIYNAKVLTVNSNFTVAKALAVRDGRIVAVGKERQLEEYRGPETRMIDAQGKTVMPGLYDGDVHSYAAAVSELNGPLPAIDSIEAAQAYIRAQATNKPAGSWIVLKHIYPTRLKDGRLPTKDELDAATTNCAVCWDFGAVAVVNSKALELSKITKDTQNPPGGEVVKEPRHSKPTGLLRNAMSLLKLPPAARPPPTAQERAALRHLYQLYNEQGITSIAEADTTPEEIDLFRSLSRSNELTVRINCARLFQPTADADESIDRLDALTNASAGKAAYGPTGAGDDWVRIGPLKTVLDGDLSIGTAYLRTPYGIGPTYMNEELAYRGELKQDAYVLPQVYLAAAQRGWQLSAHCSGDAALDFLMNCYEQVGFKLDIRDRRFLIEHSDFQAAQDWSRCAKLGAGVLVEPGSLYEDGPSLVRTLGTNRLQQFVPLKGWFERGIVAGAGSGHDAGLDSTNGTGAWNPWLGMWITLTRETRSGAQINPQERLTREQAVRFYTFNNAWLNFEDHAKGSLEPGKLADFIMVDRDIMKCPVDEIRGTKVLLTMVNGKVVWEAIEPIFPGPQVIPAITVNVTNAPTVVVAPSPVTPVYARVPSAEAAARHTAEFTGVINPYAPVPISDDQSAPTAAANPPPVSVASNAAPAVEVTAAVSSAPVASTNVIVPAQENVAATPAPAVAHSTSDTTLDTSASLGTFSASAGAAPAELAMNQPPTAAPVAPAVPNAAPTAAVITNQAPAVPVAPPAPVAAVATATNQTPAAVTNQIPASVTNQVPEAINTNAANSVPIPNQAAVAVVTKSAASEAPANQPQVAVAVPNVPVVASANVVPNTVITPPISIVATNPAAASPVVIAVAANQAPTVTPANPTPIAATTNQAPDAVAGTAASGTITNQAPGAQDWSKLVGQGGK
jgi:predicted amidohydrolase YtcJ